MYITLSEFLYVVCVVFFFKQKTAYEMRISDWSSDVCSSDLGTYVLSHGYYDAYYLQAQRVRRMIVNDFQQAFSNQCDVIMGPVTPSVAKQIGDNREDPTSDWPADIYTLGVSLAGLPAMSVPCGFGGAKRPLPQIGSTACRGRVGQDVVTSG